MAVIAVHISLVNSWTLQPYLRVRFCPKVTRKSSISEEGTGALCKPLYSSAEKIWSGSVGLAEFRTFVLDNKAVTERTCRVQLNDQQISYVI